LTHKTLGGVGGGYLTVNSRHVDIDGLIAANGLAPDSRFDQGAGMRNIFVAFLLKLKIQ
jgi:hypothetical protein